MRSLLTPLWAAEAFRDGSPPLLLLLLLLLLLVGFPKMVLHGFFCSVEGMTEIAAGCNGPETYY
jgi:hypothetical protein